MRKKSTRKIVNARFITFVFIVLVSGCSSDSDSTNGDSSLGQIELVSIGDNNTALLGNTVWGSSISSYGQIVSFTVEDTSNATTSTDIYVKNMQDGVTRHLTVDQNGFAANDESYGSDMSGDGTTVAYVSYASNLIMDDSNNEADIYVYEMELQQNRRASESATGIEGNLYSRYRPSISYSGRYVVFYSRATNLIDGVTNMGEGVYMKDMLIGSVSKLSVSNMSEEANAFSAGARISADGRFVAFVSEADNLVDNDTNNIGDVFLRDNELNQLERINLSSNGQESNGGSSWDISLSANGRYVVYASAANNLVENDTNLNQDIFIYDALLNTTRLVSVSSISVQGNSLSDTPTVSENGRYVAFMSMASNLVDDDTNGENDVFVRDMQTGITRRVSVSDNGDEANSGSTGPEISDDGRYISFTSMATNLVTGLLPLESNIY